MVTEPNLSIIKSRIVDIIKHTMYDESGEDGKFVTVKKGLPDNNHFKDIAKPACFVANASELEIDSPIGPVMDTRGIETQGASRHDFTFQIMIFDQAEDSEELDVKLDALHKELKETLKDNVKLVDPITKTDPLVIKASFGRTTHFSAEQDGKPVDGRIFLFTCLAVSA